MTGFFGAVIGKLVGGSQKEETDTQATRASNATQRNNRTLERDNSVEEISSQEARALTGSKRRRDEEGAGAGGASFKARRTSSSDHLRPDYNYRLPSDATVFHVPGTAPPSRSERKDDYDLNKDWPSTKKTTIQKQNSAKSNMGVPKRGFQPRDTLNKPAPQAATLQNGNKPPADFYTAYDPNRAKNASKSSNAGREGVSPSLTHPQQSQLDESRSRTHHKPKQQAGLPDDPIVDLTEEEEKSFFGKPTQTQTSKSSSKRKTGSSTQGSQASAPGKKAKGRDRDPNHDLLGNSESRTVDAMFDGNMRQRQPAIATDYATAAHSSVATNFSKVQSAPSARNGLFLGQAQPYPTSGSRQSPVRVDDDDDDPPEATRDHSPHKRRRLDTIQPQKPERTAPRVKSPPIDLLRGIEDWAEGSVAEEQQGSGKIIQGSVEDFEGMASTFDAHKPRAQHTSQDGRHRGSINSLDADSARISSQAPAPNLRSSFVRDNRAMSQANQQQKALRLNLKDKVQNSRVDFSDDDELTGPPTVPERRNSPQKRQGATQQPHVKASSTATRRSASPSDSKPTKFTKSRREDVQNMKHLLPKSDAGLDEDGPDDARIPIKAIYCKGVVTNQKHLELYWDGDSFLLLCERHPMQCDDPDHTMILFGQSVLRSATHSPHDPRIIFKGSANVFSSGIVLVEFVDEDGKNLCISNLAEVTGRKLTLVNSEGDPFQRTFKNLAEKEIEHSRSKKKSTRPQASAVPSQASVPPRRKTRHPSEEIVYENDDQDASRTKLRSRMQGGNLSDEIERAGYQQERSRAQERTVSEYFEPQRSVRATRQVQPRAPTTPSPPKRNVEKWTVINNPAPWHYSVVYPSEGPRRVTIDFCDLPGLDEDECLNDNVVNFWLRYIEETMPAEHKDKVHFFNTFFYSSMTTKNGKKQLNYDAVKRWTKSVDLFAKSYVVVPMCVGFHWFVIIICNLPNLKREISGFDDAAEGLDKDVPEAAIPNDEAEPEDDSAAEKSYQHDVYAFDEDGQANNAPSRELGEEAARSSPQSASAGKRSKKKGPGMRTFEVDQPTLISMDSFGLARTPEIKYLKRYLEKEADSRRSMELNQQDLQGVTAKALPQQNNLTDCGLYMLAYIEQFCKDPEPFVRKVLQRDLTIREDFAEFNPDRKREEIRNKLLDLQRAQYEQKLAQKRAKAVAKKGQTPPAAPESAVTSVPAKQKTPTPAVSAKQDEKAPTQDAQPEQLEHKAQPTSASMKTADRMDADESEPLEFEMPHAIGQQKGLSQERPSSPPSADDAKDNDDDGEEMLLDESADADPDKMDIDSSAAKKPSNDAQHVNGNGQNLDGEQVLLDNLEQALHEKSHVNSLVMPGNLHENDGLPPVDTDVDSPMRETGNESAVEEAPRKSKSPMVLVSKTEAKGDEEAAGEPEIPESQSQRTGDLSF